MNNIELQKELAVLQTTVQGLTKACASATSAVTLLREERDALAAQVEVMRELVASSLHYKTEEQKNEYATSARIALSLPRLRLPERAGCEGAEGSKVEYRNNELTNANRHSGCVRCA